MPLMMSVSGVRGIIGESMTPALASDLGAAFGSHLGGGRVIIGRDSRPSGDMVLSSLVGGLLSTGCSVVDLGVVTTPGTAMMIAELGGVGGIVITASHNPIQWNGIKFLTREGYAPPPEVAEQIIARHRNKDVRLVDVDNIGRLTRDDSTVQRHVVRVLKTVDMQAIRRRKIKVVLDSVNGAGGAEGRKLLEDLGCTVIHVNGEPTGRFAHTPEPTAENLTGLCDDVRKHSADIGFAQDPDADRLAIVDNTGRYIGEEYTIVLAAKQVLSKTPGPAAVNLSTSRMIDDLAAKSGTIVHRTAVGEAHVARAIRDKKCVIGGEGNGGIIDPRVGLVRDSLVGMALTLNLLADDPRPLNTIVDELPRYTMVKLKYEMERPKVDAWLTATRKMAATSGAKLNDADGIRLDWPEGWVHVRPSNTEPIARVISEAKDAPTAESLAKRIADLRG